MPNTGTPNEGKRKARTPSMGGLSARGLSAELFALFIKAGRRAVLSAIVLSACALISLGSVGHAKSADARIAPDYAYGAYQRGYFLTALELALPRAEEGDAAAQTLIAELYSQGFGVQRDFERAVFWYRQAAKNDSEAAQFALAMLLIDGVVVERDLDEARALLQKSADAGHAQAKFNLGQLILAGQSTDEDYNAALPLFKQASLMGIADAGYSAGQILMQGLHGLGERPQEAIPFLRSAAEQDVIAAQVELGILLVGEFLLDQDKNKIEEAYNWLRRAAEVNNPVAQNRLSQLLANGVGADADPIKAAKWHILARRAGVSDAASEQFFAKLSLTDRAEAMSQANVLARENEARDKLTALRAAKISPSLKGGSGSILDLPLQQLPTPSPPILPQ